ncbi:MAG: hypothetical protein AAF488_17725, partial [Planctomycetota bacterium]
GFVLYEEGLCADWWGEFGSGIPGGPIARFGGPAVPWTVITTVVVAFDDGESQICTKLQEITRTNSVRSPGVEKSEIEWVSVFTKRGVDEFWAPPGGPLFALQNLLMMFPLREP